MQPILPVACLVLSCGLAQASVVDTSSAALVSAFQSGLAINNFEAVATRTPQTLSAYTQGDPVAPASYVFDQIPGVQFSVGGAVGTNMPALFKLTGGRAGDARSGSTVLGPVDFSFNTNFAGGSFIEVFFPVKVARVGFWLNPSLDNVLLIAADTNFAFSGLTETTLETGTVGAGHFVGIERASADIGGFKIISTGSAGFTVDDFSFGTGGGVAPIPEPTTYALLAAGLAVLIWRQQRA